MTGEWIKACESAHCVTVMFTPEGTVLLGSTNNPEIVLAFTMDEWTAFIKGAKLGEFDDLT